MIYVHCTLNISKACDIELHLGFCQNSTRSGAGGADQETLHHRHFLPGIHHEHRRLTEGEGKVALTPHC